MSTASQIHAIRYPQVHIEEGALVAEGCNLAPGCHIGSQVKLGPNVVLERDVQLQGEIHLEHGVIIRSKCILLGPLHIGESVILAPEIEVGLRSAPGLAPASMTRILTGTRIGKQAQVLGGITVGQNVFIRSHSLIQGDVPDHAMVGGDPAILEQYVCPNCARRLILARRSPKGVLSYMRCSQCGLQEIRLLKANILRIGRVLLPGGASGNEVVNLAGHDFRWLDDHEMLI